MKKAIVLLLAAAFAVPSLPALAQAEKKPSAEERRAKREEAREKRKEVREERRAERKAKRDAKREAKKSKSSPAAEEKK